jgi:hypothetical protein
VSREYFLHFIHKSPHMQNHYSRLRVTPAHAAARIIIKSYWSSTNRLPPAKTAGRLNQLKDSSMTFNLVFDFKGRLQEAHIKTNPDDGTVGVTAGSIK